MNGYVLGNPLDEATTLGPMAHKRFADLVREQNRGGRREGREGAYRREALSPPIRGGTAYLAPQVLTEVDHSMSVMREESFGPAVGIMKVKGDEEAIRLMNDSALWPHRRDLDRGCRCGRSASASSSRPAPCS